MKVTEIYCDVCKVKIGREPMVPHMNINIETKFCDGWHENADLCPACANKFLNWWNGKKGFFESDSQESPC